jgi:aryl-alcohol dehydrogenase-like predicted oxidoreductase
MNAQLQNISASLCGTVTLGGELTVNRLGFGAMRITGEGVWGPPKDRARALAVLRRAVELGVNFIDTADSYGPNVSEELIAEALSPYPKDLVIATKGGWNRPGPDQWTHDASPEHLRNAIEGSLKRLRLDRIDVYQLHAPAPVTPFDESVEELADLRTQGKIRLVALSNVTREHVERAQKIVRRSPRCKIVTASPTANGILSSTTANSTASFLSRGSRWPRARPRTRASTRLPMRTRLSRSRSRWRGCCSVRPSCCRFLVRLRWSTSKKIWALPHCA